MVSLDEVRSALHRLFIAADSAKLRREDEQKCRELAPLLGHLGRIKKGAHLVDAAAGKASVGLVAAELLAIGRVTVIERDPARVAACRAAAGRLRREAPVDVREADVANPHAWPPAPDAVVALHACGGASDLVIDQATRSRARQLFLVPCCYGGSVSFRDQAAMVVAHMPWVSDDVIRRRMTASVIDLERKLRLEAAGYATDIEELFATSISPHNLLFIARRTNEPVRITRARERLAALYAAAIDFDGAPKEGPSGSAWPLTSADASSKNAGRHG